MSESTAPTDNQQLFQSYNQNDYNNHQRFRERFEHGDGIDDRFLLDQRALQDIDMNRGGNYANNGVYQSQAFVRQPSCDRAPKTSHVLTSGSHNRAANNRAANNHLYPSKAFGGSFNTKSRGDKENANTDLSIVK